MPCGTTEQPTQTMIQATNTLTGEVFVCPPTTDILNLLFLYVTSPQWEFTYVQP